MAGWHGHAVLRGHAWGQFACPPGTGWICHPPRRCKILEYTGGAVVPRTGGGASCTAPGVYSRPRPRRPACIHAGLNKATERRAACRSFSPR